MKKIPPKYQDEFLKKQVALTKDRLRIFAFLFMLVVVGGSLIFHIVASITIPRHLIETWVISTATCLMLILLSAKASSMRAIKMNAFFLLAVLLFMMASSHIYFSSNVYAAMVTYLFMFFSIALIIPWRPFEVMLVALITVAAFTVYFFNATFGPLRDATFQGKFIKYLQDAVILFLAYIVCFFVKQRETHIETENFLLLKDVEDRSEQMRKELDLAIRVHSKLVPRSVSSDIADIAVTYLPVRYLGGDYANYRFVDAKGLSFFICDVTGHGVSSALLVNVIHAEIENLFRETTKPGYILSQLSRRISSPYLEKTNMMLTAFCGYLDYERMKLVYSNHGHPPQYICRAEGSRLEGLESQTGMIGVSADENEYQSEVPFKKGDRVVLFTDGIPEARDREGSLFGYERLENFIRANRGLYVNVFNEKLLHELLSFSGGDFDDDIFILNIMTK